jgi:plastocyanin
VIPPARIVSPDRIVSLTSAVTLSVAVALLASCTSSSPAPSPAATAASPSTSASPSTGPTPPSGPFASVSEADYQFTPARIVIGTGQDLHILNQGPSLHNLSVSGTQVDLDTSPGETTRTEPIGGALKPGTYPFFCKYHRARGMVGVIVVVPS